MTPPPTRWWHVSVSLFGNQLTMDTSDPAKIGPWLCDIVSDLKLHPQMSGGMPVELRVTIQ